MRAMVCTVEGKGGAGKSTLAGLAVDALKQDGKRVVAIIDGDTTNSTMASMYDDVQLVDTLEQEAAGYISAVLKSTADFLVMDLGARSEAGFLNRILPRLLRTRTKAEPAFVALRPITLSSFVQANAVSFVKATAPLGVRTVLVRNLSQGRTEQHFADWDNSNGRKAALDLGAREMDLSDAGIRWGDEVPAVGLSFSAAAIGDFSRVDPLYLPLVERLFDKGVQAHLGFWVEENAERLLRVLQELGVKI